MAVLPRCEICLIVYCSTGNVIERLACSRSKIYFVSSTHLAKQHVCYSV